MTFDNLEIHGLFVRISINHQLQLRRQGLTSCAPVKEAISKLLTVSTKTRNQPQQPKMTQNNPQPPTLINKKTHNDPILGHTNCIRQSVTVYSSGRFPHVFKHLNLCHGCYQGVRYLRMCQAPGQWIPKKQANKKRERNNGGRACEHCLICISSWYIL